MPTAHSHTLTNIYGPPSDRSLRSRQVFPSFEQSFVVCQLDRLDVQADAFACLVVDGVLLWEPEVLAAL